MRGDVQRDRLRHRLGRLVHRDLESRGRAESAGTGGAVEQVRRESGIADLTAHERGERRIVCVDDSDIDAPSERGADALAQLAGDLADALHGDAELLGDLRRGAGGSP